VTAEPKKIITFVNGLLGLEQYKRYVLLDHQGTDIIKWLEALDEPNIALPVASPFTFFPDYAPKISQESLLQLNITSEEEALVLCVLTIGSNINEITMNLKAPIIINVNTLTADQVIVENPDYNVREPLKLKKACTDRRCESC